MKITYKKAAVNKIKTEAIVVNLFEDMESKKWVSGATAVIDKALGGYISKLIKNKELFGKEGEAKVFPTFGKIPAEKVIIVGLGKKSELTYNTVRKAAGAAAKAAKHTKIASYTTIVHGAGAGGLNPELAAQALVEGTILGAYKFKGLKSKVDENKELKAVEVIDFDAKKVKLFQKGGKKGEVVANSVNYSRDLVNLPGNVVTPTYLAREAARLASKNKKLKVRIFSEAQIKKLHMGAFLSIAQGSKEPCKMIVLQYRGGKKKDITALVGKGVTFDSGGISIKSSSKMREMKGDMAGAASVLGAMKAIAELKLKKSVIGVIPATENMPSGKAIKPGDVVKASNGKTIEFTSTDAEGRMILADALVYAQKLGAKKVINAATLTGACVVALGELYAAIMGNDQKLVDEVISAGKKAGERLWQLPLDKEYKDMLLKSDVADMINANEDRKAGTINGGMFLKEFINDKTKWAHLDIAGTADIHSKIDMFDKGATGFGVRTFVEFLDK